MGWASGRQSLKSPTTATRFALSAASTKLTGIEKFFAEYRAPCPLTCMRSDFIQLQTRLSKSFREISRFPESPDWISERVKKQIPFPNASGSSRFVKDHGNSGYNSSIVHGSLRSLVAARTVATCWGVIIRAELPKSLRT